MAGIVSGISTHILDLSLGRPASGVPVTLEHQGPDGWNLLSNSTTDSDGRVQQLLPPLNPLVNGSYRVTFKTETYFDRHQVVGLYPVVEITFIVRDLNGAYHIPLLLSPNGYSTYRGS